MTDITTRLAKAKTTLVLDHPFIGTIAMQKLKFDVADESWFDAMGLPATAAVTTDQAIFCEKFIETLNDQELLFLVAHECFHPMLEHNWRRQERDPVVWNHAADYVINKLLVDEGIGTMPEGGLHDEQVYADGNGMAEGIYANIYLEQPDDDNSGNGNGNGNSPTGDQPGPLDTVMDAEGTPAEKTQQAQEWKVAVAQAAQAAQIAGKLSAGLKRLVSEILDPVVDWRDVLSRFIERCRTDQRSFARPNRRFITQGMYLPSTTGERIGDVVFAVDCSGSITEGMLNQYAAEIRQVHDELKPTALHIVYFDSNVCHVDTFSPDDDVELNMHGGGGTAFSPVFKWLEDNDIHPAACVFLTDLYCSDFGDEPAYPVLWVTTGKTQAPFGEIVPFS